jgi:hypothetical protein
MKAKTWKLCMMLALLASLGTVSVSAGSNEPLIRVDIPFDFTVGNVPLAAGMYTVTEPVDGALRLLNRSAGRGIVTIITNRMNRAKPAQPGMLVFNRYGDQYFLTQVWPAVRDGYKLPQSQRERELGAMLGAPQMVTVIAAAR